MADYEEAKIWINLAERDFSIASHLYDTFIPMPIETICFHCQQYGEVIKFESGFVLVPMKRKIKS